MYREHVLWSEMPLKVTFLQGGIFCLRVNNERFPSSSTPITSQFYKRGPYLRRTSAIKPGGGITHLTKTKLRIYEWSIEKYGVSSSISPPVLLIVF